MSKRTYTADEAIAMMEEMVVSDEDSSDDEGFHKNSTIILMPPVENPDAVTDEDSDLEDTGDVNHLPRRILMAEASFSRQKRRPRPKEDARDLSSSSQTSFSCASPSDSVDESDATPAKNKPAPDDSSPPDHSGPYPEDCEPQPIKIVNPTYQRRSTRVKSKDSGRQYESKRSILVGNFS